MTTQKLFLATAIAIISLSPLTTFAADISAKSYIVTDLKSGNVIMAENQNAARVPASLTKLVTAMVVMDQKVKLNKQIAITKYDQTLGQCGIGGGCLKTKVGVKYTVDDLFHAALMPSANNAASALARSTGLTSKQFVAKMNAKVKALGATHSKFYEPTGMGEKNVTTAADYSKIVKAAFEYPYLKQVSQKRTYDVNALNNNSYDITIKNGNQIFADNVNIIGAKNGYVGSISGYNYGAVVQTASGRQLSLVVLGEPHMYTAYSDSARLVDIAENLMR